MSIIGEIIFTISVALLVVEVIRLWAMGSWRA